MATTQAMEIDMIFVLRFIMITVLVVLKNNGINRLQRYEKIVSILPTETEKIIGKKTISFFPIIYIMLNRNFYNRVNSNLEKVASIFVGENGLTTKCNYEYILSELIKEAGRYGANYLVFVERQNPSWRSSCYQMRALAYWVDPSLLNKQKEVKKEEKNTDE